MSTKQEITFQNMNEVLPEGWLALKLGDVIDYGKTQKIEPANISNETWVLELEDIEKDTSKLLSRIRFLERKSKSAKNKFNQGDVLYGKLRPYLNKVFIADESGVCTTEIVPISKSPFLDSAFVFYWLKSLFFINYVSGVVYGLNMPRLGTKEGLSAPFFLPPLAEQQEIATRLDDLLAQVDAIKARLDAIPAILKRFRQAVLAAAVSGKLTEDWREKQCLPLMFDEKSIEAIVSSNKYSLGIGPFGSNLKVDDYRDTGHPLIFVREIRANSFGDLKTKYVNQEKFDELKAHRAKPGVILITKMGDPPGDVAIYPSDRPEAVITADCIKLEVNETIVNKSYVYFCMQNLEFREEVLKISAGVAQQKVNLRSFRKLALKLPPLPEQTEIVNRVEQLFAFAGQIEQQVQAAQTRVNQLTQAILAKAFKGELTAAWRAAHPELISGENSAEALLEKIKATQASIKPKRGSLNLAI